MSGWFQKMTDEANDVEIVDYDPHAKAHDGAKRTRTKLLLRQDDG